MSQKVSHVSSQANIWLWKPFKICYHGSGPNLLKINDPRRLRIVKIFMKGEKKFFLVECTIAYFIVVKCPRDNPIVLIAAVLPNP